MISRLTKVYVIPSNFELMCLHLVDRPDKISRYHVGAVVLYFFFIYGVYINFGVHWAFGVASDAICGKKKK